MDAQSLQKWRNELLTRLENLIIDARQIQQIMRARGLSELEDKSDFRAKWQRIWELFPDDFHPDRAGDLARHLRFAELHDFSDIENFDIPAVIDSVNRYGRSGTEFILEELERVHIGSDVSDLLHPQVKDACVDLISKRQFGEAAQKAVGLLMDELRRLSGKDADGDSLIRQAIGTNPNSVALSDCETNNSKQVTEGLKLIAQGLYKGVRNPVAHGWNELRSTDVLQIMAIVSFLLTNLRLLPSIHDD